MKKILGFAACAIVIGAGSLVLHQRGRELSLAPAEKQSLHDAVGGGPDGVAPTAPMLDRASHSSCAQVGTEDSCFRSYDEQARLWDCLDKSESQGDLSALCTMARASHKVLPDARRDPLLAAAAQLVPDRTKDLLGGTANYSYPITNDALAFAFTLDQLNDMQHSSLNKATVAEGACANIAALLTNDLHLDFEVEFPEKGRRVHEDIIAAAKRAGDILRCPQSMSTAAETAPKEYAHRKVVLPTVDDTTNALK